MLASFGISMGRLMREISFYLLSIKAARHIGVSLKYELFEILVGAFTLGSFKH